MSKSFNRKFLENFLNLCEERGYEFHLVASRYGLAYNIWIYNPSENNHNPFDLRDPFNYIDNNYTPNVYTPSQYKGKLSNDDILAATFPPENSKKLNYEFIFSNYGKGKIFAEIYKKTPESEKDLLLGYISSFLASVNNFQSTFDLFYELQNYSERELKKIWNKISKKDLPFSSRSYLSPNKLSSTEFLRNILDSFETEKAENIVLHIVKNRQTQINGDEYIATALRDVLVDYYSEKNATEKLEKFAPYIRKVENYLKNEDKQSYLSNIQKNVISTTIDYQAVESILRVPKWTIDHYAVWFVELSKGISSALPDIEKTNIFHKKEKDDKKVSSTTAFMTLKNNSTLTLQEINKAIENYYQFLNDNNEMASKISTNAKDNELKRKQLVETWGLRYKMNQELSTKDKQNKARANKI